jgi:hypothetical protein
MSYSRLDTVLYYYEYVQCKLILIVSYMCISKGVFYARLRVLYFKGCINWALHSY